MTWINRHDRLLFIAYSSTITATSFSLKAMTFTYVRTLFFTILRHGKKQRHEATLAALPG
jgi:hypothetical protein